MASTHVIPLGGNRVLTGNTTAIATQTATALRITKVNIEITAEADTMQVELTFGNMVSGNFVPLSVDSAKVVVTIPQAAITTFSNGQLSPAEKLMTPFTIITNRIGAYLKANVLGGL